MDGSKEILCAMHGDKFLERGFANFIYDGPGQGECTISEIFVTPTNHMDAARAVYAASCQASAHRQRARSSTGVSFGSYFGLQMAAALGDRLKGVAVSMVCHQPGMNAIMDMASPSFKMRFMYMAGFEDERKFDAFMRKFTLAAAGGQDQMPGADPGRRGRRAEPDRVLARAHGQNQGAEELRRL